MTLARRIDRLERNLLINGGFQWFQRNTGAVTLTGSASYLSVDRWRLWYANNGTAPTSILSTDVPSIRTKRSLSFSINASNANAQLYASQRIEALRAMDVAGDSVSFAVKVKSGSARAITLSLAYPSAENNFTTTTQFFTQTKVITNDGVWQLVEFEAIGVPSQALNGLMVTVMLSDFGVLGTAQSHYLGESVLNFGDDASAFQWAGGSAHQDVPLCQRFYEKSYDLDTTPGTATFSGSITFRSASSSVEYPVSFKATKIVQPTCACWNPFTGAINSIRDNSASTNAASNAGANHGTWGFFAQQNPGGAAGNQYAFHFTADSEI